MLNLQIVVSFIRMAGIEMLFMMWNPLIDFRLKIFQVHEHSLRDVSSSLSAAGT